MKISSLNNNTLSRLFDTNEPVLLRGAPGIAKTAKLLQFTEQAELGCVVEFLPAMDAPDAMGFLIPTKGDGGAPVSRYSKPSWLARIEETGKDRGMLLLDEFLAADHLVQKAFAPLLSERKIGQWELPEGWVVWMTGNRQEDKAGANRMLSHIANRVFILDMQADPDGWVNDFATPSGMHPMYIAFAKARPGLIFGGEPPKDPNAPFASPRSLTKAHEFHAAGIEDNNLPHDDVTREVVAGMIGEGTAMELFSFIKTKDELPDIEDMIENPETAKLPKPERLDAQYVAAQMAVHYANPETVNPLFTYVTRLNKELQTSVAIQMIQKSGGALLNSEALTKFVAENKALITATLS